MRALLLGVLVSLLCTACTIHLNNPGPSPHETPQPAPQPVDPTPPGLRAMTPVYLNGNEDLVLDHVYISTHTDAISVSGNATLTLIDSVIDADGYGIILQGNGDVHLRNCSIRGGLGAAIISSNGSLYLSGSELSSTVEVLGNGDVIDEGGNSWTW